MSSTNCAARGEALAAQAVDAAEEPDVLIDRQRFVEREPLRHVADAPLDAFGIAADVDAADQRRAARSARAGRTACGWSWTCRRRWRRGSRRSRPASTSNDRWSTATNSPKRRVSSRTSMAAVGSWVRDRRIRRAAEGALQAARPGGRWRGAGARELGLRAARPARRARRWWWPRRRRSGRRRRGGPRSAARTPSRRRGPPPGSSADRAGAAAPRPRPAVSNSFRRASSARTLAAASATSARVRPPSQNVQLTLTPRSQDGCQCPRAGRSAGSAARSRSRRRGPWSACCRRHRRWRACAAFEADASACSSGRCFSASEPASPFLHRFEGGSCQARMGRRADQLFRSGRRGRRRSGGGARSATTPGGSWPRSAGVPRCDCCASTVRTSFGGTRPTSSRFRTSRTCASARATDSFEHAHGLGRR